MSTASEVPATDFTDDEDDVLPTYPPYRPYKPEPVPPSIHRSIATGYDIRRKHKSTRKEVNIPPLKPAKPRGPKATDVFSTRKELLAYRRCMKKHGFVLSDRLEYLARPPRRHLIYLWRDNADKLPPETIVRLRNMLLADEPFKPDQAYEYFTALKKTKKKKKAQCLRQMKSSRYICRGKKFEWTRHAAVKFARGIMKLLAPIGIYEPRDGMLRLSNRVLGEICTLTNTKIPSRCPCTRSKKALFNIEMADKIASWIDGIMGQADERMLMMDIADGDDLLDELEGDDDYAINGGAGDGKGDGGDGSFIRSGTGVRVPRKRSGGSSDKGPDDGSDRKKSGLDSKTGLDDGKGGKKTELDDGSDRKKSGLDSKTGLDDGKDGKKTEHDDDSARKKSGLDDDSKGKGTGGDGTGGKDTGGDGAAGKGTGGDDTGGDGAAGKGTGGDKKDTGGDGKGVKKGDVSAGGISGNAMTGNGKEGTLSDEDERRRRLLAGLGDMDPDRADAWKILHKSLNDRGQESMHKEGVTEMQHKQGSQWLKDCPEDVDKTMSETREGIALAATLETKLDDLVKNKTPENIKDVMQDVVVEAAQTLAAAFLTKAYQATAKEALINAMQRRGSDILAEVGGAAETSFFAAQRLKLNDPQNVSKDDINQQLSAEIQEVLNDIVNCESMPKKLLGTTKRYTKVTSNFLSGQVTKPDQKIEAYVALLQEMEAAGDQPLVDQLMIKSYKDSAEYLRYLTSFEDKINKPNSSLQSNIEGKLKKLMSKAPANGYKQDIMNKVIAENTKLLVSYIMLQAEKTKVMEALIALMDQAGDDLLLRHGNLRKVMRDGANLLRGKTSEDIKVSGAQPVVVRKIFLRLSALVKDRPIVKQHEKYIEDVIKDVSQYLAIALLQSRVVKVCKCMKDAIVQCEVWCEEALRRLPKPCCSCVRRYDMNVVADLMPGVDLYAPGTKISFTECPTSTNRQRSRRPGPCTAPYRAEFCGQNPNVHYLYKTLFHQKMLPTNRNSAKRSASMLLSPRTISKVVTEGHPLSKINLSVTRYIKQKKRRRRMNNYSSEASFDAVGTDVSMRDCSNPSFAQCSYGFSYRPDKELSHNLHIVSSMRRVTKLISRKDASCGDTLSQDDISTYLNSGTEVISDAQISKWHALVINLLWNAEAWLDWMKEHVEIAHSHRDSTKVECVGDWNIYFKKATTQGEHWLRCNNFNRNFIKKISCEIAAKKQSENPTAIIKVNQYLKNQEETLHVLDAINQWTQWLLNIFNDSDDVKNYSGSRMTLQQVRWNSYKRMIHESIQDWIAFQSFLKHVWAEKYKHLLSEFVPKWNSDGPVWVMSTLGAVPCGASVAGYAGGETLWIARATYKKLVIPGVVNQFKHCCTIYADGGTHFCTTYQVLCNAHVQWVKWRGGDDGLDMSPGAVQVSSGVYAGRVRYKGHHLVGAVLAPHYRCHVQLQGRPVAFTCYELLVIQHTIP